MCIGWPGSMPEDQVLEKSALHQRLAADFSFLFFSVNGLLVLFLV
jgi:hypothetical protein